MKISLSRLAGTALLLSSQFALRGVSAAEDDDADDEPECRLWLAPSYLSLDNSIKYGLFAGVDFDVNDTIPDVELGFPFVDFLVDPNRNTRYHKGILDYLEGLMWTADYAGAKFEGNHSATTFVPGVGALSNYHSGFTNVDWLQGSVLMREREDITEPGKAHLSRGAIASTYNMTMIATRPIPAGMELFANFGDVWDDKSEENTYQDKFYRQDYVDADAVLDRIVNFFDEFDSEMDDDFKEDMLDFMLDKVLLGAGEKRAKVIKSLIPASPRRLKKVQEAGGTFMYRYSDMIHTPKWFTKHGLCVDKLYAKKSTVPEAGRGAFASRSIAKGEVIVPIPTVLIGQRDLLEMFEIDVTDPHPNGPPSQRRKKIQVFNRENPLGKQLVSNYCYGHAESSLFLLPQAPMVNYVNHAPTREQVNAHLQWSTHDSVSNDVATHDHTVEEVMEFRSNMVVLELVADKDIAKDEEVFIDYGPDWVAAWEDYKAAWERRTAKDDSWPLKAEDVRSTFANREYPLMGSTAAAALPDGIATACFIKHEEPEDGRPQFNEEEQEILKWDGTSIAYEEYVGADLSLCDLVQVQEDGEGSWIYTVKAQPDPKKDHVIQVYGVPHAAITLVDQPYRSDVLDPNAFRHYIAVPDQQWPQMWRDLRD